MANPGLRAQRRPWPVRPGHRTGWLLMLGAVTVPPRAIPLTALRFAPVAIWAFRHVESPVRVSLAREQGLAYDVRRFTCRASGGAPFVFPSLQLGGASAEATSQLLQEWQRLLDSTLSDTELAAGSGQYRGSGRRRPSDLRSDWPIAKFWCWVTVWSGPTRIEASRRAEKADPRRSLDLRRQPAGLGPAFSLFGPNFGPLSGRAGPGPLIPLSSSGLGGL